MYLLDTNACIEFLRGKNAGIVAEIKARSSHELHVCSIVLAELCFGALRGTQAAANMARVGQFAAALTCLPFDNQAARIHAQIRADLAAKATTVGPHDLQIAAIALTRGLTVVTHDLREFQRVPGLSVVDWQS